MFFSIIHKPFVPNSIFFYNKLNDMELQILEVKYSIIFTLFFLEVKHIFTLSL